MKNADNKKRICCYLIIAVLVIGLDQLSKLWIRSNLYLGERIPIIGNWFNITYIQNTGTAFSMFAGNKFVTIVLTTVLIAICIFAIIKEVKAGDYVLPLCLCFVISGGVANMIDRLYLGFVTDMISVGSFAIFNVADIAVTCGCFAAMIYVLLTFKDEEKK